MAANATGAIDSVVEKVKDILKKKDCNKCGPDTRIEAMIKAYLFAGISPLRDNLDPMPWKNYNYKDSKGYAQAMQDGDRHMGYKMKNGRGLVEDHPGGHNDNNAPHHDCPHFHAVNAAGQRAIFIYKLR